MKALKKVAARAATAIGVADDKATANLKPARTLRKVNAASWATAVAAVIGETVNPQVADLFEILIFAAGPSWAVPAADPLGIIGAAIYGYVIPWLVGYVTPEPETSIQPVPGARK